MRTNNDCGPLEADEDFLDETDDQFDDSVVYESGDAGVAEGHDPNYVEDMYLGGIVKDKGGWRLKENEEIFTDEYMRQYDRYITEKAKKEKRQNLWISVGVIVICVLGIVGITALVFWLHT